MEEIQALWPSLTYLALWVRDEWAVECSLFPLSTRTSAIHPHHSLRTLITCVEFPSAPQDIFWALYTSDLEGVLCRVPEI